jgi:hypothetical protein
MGSGRFHMYDKRVNQALTTPYVYKDDGAPLLLLTVPMVCACAYSYCVHRRSLPPRAARAATDL